MWRLLPALLLVSCATQQPNESVAEQRGPEGSRVVRSLVLPLTPAPSFDGRQSATKEFQHRDTRGRVSESGVWSIRTEVTHTRLRCATYETGIQLGRGNADCSEVQWVTPLDVGTRQTHCNSATLIHTGGGDLGPMKDPLDAYNCVRVITRCTGPC